MSQQERKYPEWGTEKKKGRVSGVLWRVRGVRGFGAPRRGLEESAFRDMGGRWVGGRV